MHSLALCGEAAHLRRSFTARTPGNHVLKARGLRPALPWAALWKGPGALTRHRVAVFSAGVRNGDSGLAAGSGARSDAGTAGKASGSIAELRRWLQPLASVYPRIV